MKGSLPPTSADMSGKARLLSREREEKLRYGSLPSLILKEGRYGGIEDIPKNASEECVHTGENPLVDS